MTKRKLDVKQIVIFGSFSGRNKGDLAILRSMLTQLRNNRKHLTVHLFSKDPSKLREYLRDIILDNQSANSIHLKVHVSLTGYIGLETVPVLAKCDRVIIGGGGLFFDTKLLNPFFSHVLNLFFITALIRLLYKPTLLFAVGCSHLSSKLSRVLTRFIINSAQIITVRDKSSKSELSCLTNKNILTVVDPAFSLSPFESARAKDIVDRWPEGKKILLALHRYMFAKFRIPDSATVLEQFLYSVHQFSRQNGYSILTYENRTEQTFAYKIAKLYGKSARTMLEGENLLLPEELIYLFSKFDFVVATQMHVGIFAYLADVPLMSLIYDDKVEEFNKQIGNRNYLYIAEMGNNLKVAEVLSAVAASKATSRDKSIQADSKEQAELLNEFVWS
ncbi:hypothetical protein ES707_21432 [subsurface metagenome]